MSTGAPTSSLSRSAPLAAPRAGVRPPCRRPSRTPCTPDGVGRSAQPPDRSVWHDASAVRRPPTMRAGRRARSGLTRPRPPEVIMELWPGKPYPLGATYDGSGVNFALFSEVAECVELCLIDDGGAETR